MAEINSQGTRRFQRGTLPPSVEQSIFFRLVMREKRESGTETEICLCPLSTDTGTIVYPSIAALLNLCDSVAHFLLYYRKMS